MVQANDCQVTEQYKPHLKFRKKICDQLCEKSFFI